jgi:hypothetical protein
MSGSLACWGAAHGGAILLPIASVPAQAAVNPCASLILTACGRGGPRDLTPEPARMDLALFDCLATMPVGEIRPDIVRLAGG